ncbi:MAG: DUF2341 domain-containing protein [Thermoplasmatales archaeon]|nr:DUF2341 domain-containing protein [Thermoplasmatales archaeon]
MIKDVRFKEQHVSISNPILIAGSYHCFDVSLITEAQKITIIAYQGDDIPDPQDRSLKNYYRWEYDHGIWKDVSGHDSLYIRSSKCLEENHTYSFYLGIDNKANPGRWTIKVIVDDTEVSSTPSFVIVASFNFFLSAIIGISKPNVIGKKLLVNSDLICSDRKRIMVGSENNIEERVDKVLRKDTISEHKEKSTGETLDLFLLDETPSPENELIKSTASTYPRSRLKKGQSNALNSLFFNKKWGGNNGFCPVKLGGYKKFLAIILTIVLLFVAFVPIISPQETTSSSYPSISSFDVFPDMVNLGDSLLLNVSASDSVGVASVVAEISGLETVNLSFVEGTIVNDTIYSGFWQNIWLVHDIDPGNYTIMVTVLNRDNISVSQHCAFTVLQEDNNVDNPIDNFFESKNQTSSDLKSGGTIFIVDKRHEELTVLPGASFYVERTIDGPHGTNVVFVPMFSDALTLETIEVVEDTIKNEEKNANSDIPKVFITGNGKCEIEREIERLREKLPTKIKALNKIAYTDHVELQSPRTIRMWFRAPSWEELQSGLKPSYGEISYLVFSDENNLDFEGSTWWNSNWGYRKLITVNSSQVNSDLVNFPILVSNTDGDLANKAQNDGDDIAFVLYSDNSTQLNHEIELFNGTTGEIVAWVNVTSLNSSVDTKIWMYYNNSVCSSQENVSGTWDSNYVSVWHFHGNSLNDSTSYGYDGINSGTSYNASCKIAGGRQYNGDHRVDINNFATISTALTAETWIYRSTSDIQPLFRLFTEGLNWNDNDWCLYWRTGPQNMRFVINSNDYSTGGSFDFSGTWVHTAITYDAGDAYLYNNGALEVDWSGQYGATINNVYDTLTIGNQNGGGRDWNGSLDEARISNIKRSTDWINTSYNTMNSPDTFLSFGSEQNVTDTSVDKISPYMITYSPLIITATAASGLNNVTLWYRYSTDNSSWDSWVENETDTVSPWEWSFGFYNGTGFYEFYSIGKKSGFPDESAPGIADTICFYNGSLNTVPAIDLIYPAPNGTTNVSREPICRIWANDSDGGMLDVYWYENTTGPWTLRQINPGVPANSSVSWTFNQADLFSTSYWWKAVVNDSISNASAVFYFTTEALNTSVDPISPYIVTTSLFNINATGPSDLDNVTLYYRWSDYNFTDWDTLTYDDFEDASGDPWTGTNYTDGGGDCLLYTGGTYAHQGNNSADIQDNSGVASSFYHTNGIDVHTPEYEYIKVDFWFTADDMEVGEDFWVRYFNGSSWNTVATYVAGTDFVNGPFYHETVWINESVYTFPSDMQIRFQCDASINSDDVYIDQIYVNATTILPGNSTDWVIWSNNSNPDVTSPWNWSFDFPNSKGHYEFYSIGKKSGSADEPPPASADAICYFELNPPPSIENVSPANGSTGVSLQPTCKIKANDANGDQLTVYWLLNTTGPWEIEEVNYSVPANSTVSWTYSDADAKGITYWWKVAVNDSKSNTSAVFHFTTETLNTSVDPISPYIVTTSPFNINATGSSDLDNVTLYYRWSENNFSWTTLTYDDFENASGDPWIGTNYTDGGGDCSLYTGGTYAHQGSNAADIQDNSGLASSFYHTNGIDVDTPGYQYIKVDFWFTAVSMENGEDFWVRYFNGSSWNTVATYVAGTDFVNGPFYHEIVWINESVYTFPSDMQIRFQCDASTNGDDIFIDQIYVNATTTLGDSTKWDVWNNPSNPDNTFPWNWSFDFPEGTGYYEFYSIGKESGSADETPPASADAICYYYAAITPIINNYNLMNSTDSKLNSVTGLLDVNSEYYFTINITEPNGWDELEYINITAWYDSGSDSSTYNQTQGGNLNMFLQYENATGTANFSMLWPDGEAQLVLANCSETSINSTTRIINISFKPGSQVRWASSNDSWDSTQNMTNDPYSWNFNITVKDATGRKAWKVDEYGVYKFTSILPDSDWVDVIASPGFSDTSNIVTITYSSNYNFNISVYFEENLTNTTWMDTITIANNVWILADADPNDDITSDKMFNGIGEVNAMDIFNISGVFSSDNVSQTVDVQFRVDIPFGTHSGEYVARVASRITQD